ncbi:MAG: restriction endonuclease subunit S [Nitrospira sp.]|nr:restriction endonuclease subunit S [Nitrospira sp.]
MNRVWPWCPLGELFEIGAGKTMSAAARNGTDRTPFLRTSNVLWDQIDLSSVDEMSIPEHERFAKLLRTGDLLVCEGGEIGRAAIWNGEVETMSFQNHLHRLRPIVKEVEPRFYVYFLQSAFTQLGIFEGTGNKTTIPNLSRSRLAALRVPQPTLDEQQAIVAVLARIRDAIKTHEQSIALALDLKHAAMKSLFTRGLRGEGQKETEIGPMPEGWELVPIGKFAHQIQYGLSIRGAESGTYPILRMNCQHDGKVIFRDLQYVDIDNETADTYRVNQNDLLFNRTNSYELVGRTAIVEQTANAVFASYLIRVAVDETRLHPKFLNYFLNWDSAQIELKKLASRGVSQANISAGKLRGFQVPVPLLDEQDEIVSVLDAIDRKIDLHRRKHTVLEELFKTLLHKLMTGEVQVEALDLSGIKVN